MKKALMFLLLAALSLTLSLAPAFAADPVTETGQNDSPSEAQRVPVNTYVTGILDSKKDIDYYRVDTDEPGCFRLAFEHEYMDHSDFVWAVTLTDGDSTELITFGVPGNKTKSVFDPIGLPAGTFFIRVSGYYSSSNADIAYSLKLEYEPSDAWEKELNESFGTANRVSVNKTVNGALRTKDDADYYRFSLDEPGAVSISLNHEYLETKEDRWRATLYDEDCVPLNSYGFIGSKTKNTADPVGLPAGTYFICIESYYTSSSAFSGIPYELTLNYTASDAWEKELNDSFASATRILPNRPFSGTVMDKDDIDFYAVDLEDGPGYIQLSFSHEYLETKEYRWKTTLYDEDNVAMVTYDLPGNKTKNTFDPVGLPGGRYYLRIESYYTSSGATSSTPYEFSVAYTPDLSWEREINDTFSGANRVETGVPVSGSVMHDKDVDYYRVEIPKAGPYRLTFSHEYIETGEYRWKVTLYDADSAERGTFTVTGNETRPSFGGIQLNSGIYYFRVESYYTGSASASVVYQLTVLPE